MILIDGSQGEGGGQILRTALALSLVTGKAFEVQKIRAGRKKAGLMRQHLTAVNAAVDIGQATVEGNEIGSSTFRFAPKTIKAGEYHFAIGTAGSCTLVLQAVLPALIVADGPSKLKLEGGTHNPYSPSFDFLEKVFLPLLNRMGPNVSVQLKRPGFYPAGGGHMEVLISPEKKIERLNLSQRGDLIRNQAVAVVSQIDPRIAKRELKVIADKLSWPAESLIAKEVTDSPGPGNILTLEVESEALTELFIGFGERGVSAERVAQRTIKQYQEYIKSDAPVGRYLADQILIPMALAGEGLFRTLPLTEHTKTNMNIIKLFLDVDFEVTIEEKGVREIRVVS